MSFDPAVLFEYMEGLSCDSKSDHDFDVMFCVNGKPRSSGFPTYIVSTDSYDTDSKIESASYL